MKQRGANASRLAVVGLVGVGALIMTFQNCARYAAKPQTDSGIYSSVTPSPLSAQSSCVTPDGQVKKSGESFSFAKTPTAGSAGCQYLARVCSNGQWLGDASYMYGQCAESDKSCSFDGSKVINGGQTSKLYFKSEKAPLGKTCADVSNASNLKCVNGEMQGLATYPYASCHEGCTLNGIVFQHGDITQDFFFKQPKVTSGTCFDNGNASQLICKDGQMLPKDGGSGTFAYGKCIVETGTGSTAGTGSTGTSGTPGTGTGSTAGTGSTGTSGTPGTGTGNTSGSTTKKSCTVGTGTTAVTYKDGDNIDYYYKKEAVLPGTMCSDNSNRYIQKCSDGVVTPPPAADLGFKFRSCHTMTASNDPRLVHIIRYYFAKKSRFTYSAIRGNTIITVQKSQVVVADASQDTLETVKVLLSTKGFVFNSDDIIVESVVNLQDPTLLTNSREFSDVDYKYLYSDLNPYSSTELADHYRKFGKAEKRSPNILFNTTVYGQVYPAVSTAIDADNQVNGCRTDPVMCKSYFDNHFYNSGSSQGFDYMINFDEHGYLFNPNNVDVLDAVIRKTSTGVNSGLSQYLFHGRQEQRPPALIKNKMTVPNDNYSAGIVPYSLVGD